MANKKISELTEANEINDTDELVIVQNGVTKKIKANNLNKNVLSKLIQMTTICSLNDCGNGVLAYNISKLLEDNLIKMEIGYGNSIIAAPTYAEIEYKNGNISVGEGTKYITLRLTYSDIGEVEVYIGSVLISGAGLG